MLNFLVTFTCTYEIYNVQIMITFQSNKLRISATRKQIADTYLTEIEMCDTAANDRFKCGIVTIRKSG